jgi:hypothetical protein
VTDSGIRAAVKQELALSDEELASARAGFQRRKWGRALGRLQKYREQADYGATMLLDAASIAEELPQAEEICRLAREFLQEAGLV